MKSKLCLLAVLLALISVHVSAQSNLLKKKIDFSVEDERLEDVLFLIADIGNFSFSYNPSLLPVDSAINLHVEQTAILDVLKALLGNELEIKISGSHLVILKTRFSEASGGGGSTSGGNSKQSITIDGYVQSSQMGTYIPKVTVYDVDKLYSVITDSTGYFSLEVSTKKDYVGLAFIRPDFRDTAIVLSSKNQKVNVDLQPKQASAIETLDNYDIKEVSRVNNLKIVDIVAPQQSMVSSGNESIYVHRFAQVSFLPFLGTNLLMSGMTENDVSVNILAGYNGAVNGFEMAGLANINRYYSHGVQVSGIFNAIGEETKGLQLAGIANTNLGTVRGVQMAGINNLVLDTLKGLQFSGINNVISGKLQGVQFAGINNMAMQDVDGAQLSGITNIAIKDVNKVQMAGIANFGRNIGGAQLAGIFNASYGVVQGAQMAGILNVGKRVVKLQMAGIGNVSVEESRGLQLATIFNFAMKNSGVQLALVNIADTVSGVSVGLINLVRKGYNKLEISTNEVLYYNARVKFGTRKFYNIVGLGTRGFSQGNIWGYSYGIGRAVPIGSKKRSEINFDLTYTDLQNDDTWFEDVNPLIRLNMHFNVRINKYLSIFGGPTWSQLFYPEDYQDTAPYIRDVIPYSLYKKKYGNTWMEGWIGGEIGLRVF